MSGCAAVGCSNRGDRGYFMKSFPRDPERRALWASQMKRDYWQPNNNSRLCEVHFDDDQWEKTRQDGTRKLKCNAVPTLFKSPKEKLKKPKARKPRFIVTSTSGVSTIQVERCIEDQNCPMVAAEEENVCLFGMDSKMNYKPQQKSISYVAKPILKSVFRHGSISQDRKRDHSKPQLSCSTFGTKTLKCSALSCGDSDFRFYKFPLDNPILLKIWLRICDKDFEPDAQSVICGRHFSLDCFETGSEAVIKDDAIPTICEAHLDCNGVNNTDHEEARREMIRARRSSDLPRNLESLDNQDREIINIVIEPGDTDTKYCRLCAKSNSNNNVPIFGDSDLAEKISRCLPIIIQPTDNLPLEICQECLYNLNICYKMIIGSLEADSFLRSELSETNKPHRSEEPDKDDSSVKEEPVFRINGPIKCDLCDDYFEDMNVFDKHIESLHLLEWRCSLCDHSFETSQELLAHKTLNHSGHIVTCESCGSSDYIEEIDRGVSQDEIESDKLLGKSTDSQQLINDSEKAKEIAEKLANLNCTKCKIAFDDAKQFRKHHTIHLPRRIKCTVCLKRCPSLFDYLNHVKVAHNQKKISQLSKRNTVHGCKYCKKVFLIKQQLVIHLRKHTKEMLDDPSVTIYKCVTCPKKFVDKALYQKHRNVHDPACWHKFRCYICNRSFMDKFKLKIHQSIHDGVKPYQCDVCGQMFNRNANMIRHRAKHFEQKCRHCDETFTNTQSLKEHLKDIHGDTLNPKSNRKPGMAERMKTNNSTGDNFVCRYCGKQLTSYYSLLDHERIHTGDKPYVCQNCGKAFRSITARWDHMVRHEKGNYVCELCGKIMSNKLNLRRHLRKHAAIEQRRFECKECGKLFHVRWKLNAHLVRIHHSTPTGD